MEIPMNWRLLLKANLLVGFVFLNISVFSKPAFDYGLDTTAIERLKKTLLKEEENSMSLFKHFFAISSEQWAGILYRMKQLERFIRDNSLAVPLERPCRDSKIPLFIVAQIEKIAQSYGIHPKSMHIKLSAVSKNSKEKNYIPAHVETPSLRYIEIKGSIVEAAVEEPVTIYLHPLYIKNFDASKVKTLYHEMMHIRELNGWKHGFIVSELKKFGHDVDAHPKAQKIVEYCKKLYERNTDLLIALENREMADLCALYYQEYCKNFPAAAELDDESHFSRVFMNKWLDLIFSLYNGQPFDQLLPSILSLQQEQLKRVV